MRNFIKFEPFYMEYCKSVLLKEENHKELETRLQQSFPDTNDFMECKSLLNIFPNLGMKSLMATFLIRTKIERQKNKITVDDIKELFTQIDTLAKMHKPVNPAAIIKHDKQMHPIESESTLFQDMSQQVHRVFSDIAAVKAKKEAERLAKLASKEPPKELKFAEDKQTNLVYVDNNIEIYTVNNIENLIKYSLGYYFCVKETSNYYSYRLRDQATFYFIYPRHGKESELGYKLLLLNIRKKGTLSVATEKNDEIPKESLAQYVTERPELAQAVKDGVFKTRPLNSEEHKKVLDTNRAVDDETYANFNNDIKYAYISRGWPLTNPQWDVSTPDQKNSYINLMVNNEFRTDLTKHQLESIKNLTGQHTGLYKRYLEQKTRKIENALERRQSVTENDWGYMTKEQKMQYLSYGSNLVTGEQVNDIAKDAELRTVYLNFLIKNKATVPDEYWNFLTTEQKKEYIKNRVENNNGIREQLTRNIVNEIYKDKELYAVYFKYESGNVFKSVLDGTIITEDSPRFKILSDAVKIFDKFPTNSKSALLDGTIISLSQKGQTNSSLQQGQEMIPMCELVLPLINDNIDIISKQKCLPYISSIIYNSGKLIKNEQLKDMVLKTVEEIYYSHPNLFDSYLVTQICHLFSIEDELSPLLKKIYQTKINEYLKNPEYVNLIKESLRPTIFSDKEQLLELKPEKRQLFKKFFKTIWNEKETLDFIENRIADDAISLEQPFDLNNLISDTTNNLGKEYIKKHGEEIKTFVAYKVMLDGKENDKNFINLIKQYKDKVLANPQYKENLSKQQGM